MEECLPYDSPNFFPYAFNIWYLIMIPEIYPKTYNYVIYLILYAWYMSPPASREAAGNKRLEDFTG